MIDNLDIKKLMNNFDLLCQIVHQPSENNDLKVDLTNIRDIIDNKIPDTLKKNAPEDFYGLYIDFKSEFEKFKEYILYDKLIGKNVIGLGGGFSSGKSSFLNALLGKSVLPHDIDPSTSVPTYIISGEKHEVMGINVFDAKVQMEPKNIKQIAYGFGEIEDDEEEVIREGITLGHLLESIFFSTPWHKFSNVAFLDTPGYSKPDSEKYSVKTDEQIARGQLNTCNYILWFVQSDAGTITDADINFIKSLNEDIPKIVILSKADKKNIKDLKEIKEKISSVLDLKGIRCNGVFAFTSKAEQIGDKKLNQYLAEDKQKITKQINAWNQQIYESNFARNFKVLFVRCREFYEEAIDEESRNLTKLNTSITKLIGEDIEPRILEPLQKMVKETQESVNELKTVLQKTKDLQNEFFSEIKKISDKVGIAMPEPSEIDLLQDKVQNPMKLLEEYNRTKGIKPNKEIVNILSTAFENVEPVITRCPGGSKYHEEVMAIIKEL